MQALGERNFWRIKKINKNTYKQVFLPMHVV
jgi:hypothetical protein